MSLDRRETTRPRDGDPTVRLTAALAMHPAATLALTAALALDPAVTLNAAPRPRPRPQVGLPRDAVSAEKVELFCRQAWNLKVVKTRSLGEEYAAAMLDPDLVWDMTQVRVVGVVCFSCSLLLCLVSTSTTPALSLVSCLLGWLLSRCH